jgi:hypothetical protein
MKTSSIAEKGFSQFEKKIEEIMFVFRTLD